MLATLIASGTGDVGDRASGIDNERESLRRRPDPEPRSVIPVEKEIVVEAHASIGADFGGGSLEVATQIRGRRRRRRRRFGKIAVERQQKGGARLGVRRPEEERGGGDSSESKEEEEGRYD